MNRRSFLSSLMAAALAPAIRFFPAPAAPAVIDLDVMANIFAIDPIGEWLEKNGHVETFSASEFLHRISTNWEKIYFYGRR